MNWGSILSAVIGAITGGIFLLIGQRYVVHESHEKAKRIVLLESLRNLEGLIENVRTIELNNNPIGTQITLTVKIDAFLRYEEDLMSNRLDEFQEISKFIGNIQIAKVKSQWWCPTITLTPQDTIKESKNTLIDLLLTCISLVEILSKRISARELNKIGKTNIVMEAEEKLNKLKESKQAFTLVPPYEEWPFPRTPATNQGLS